MKFGFRLCIDRKRAAISQNNAGHIDHGAYRSLHSSVSIFGLLCRFNLGQYTRERPALGVSTR